MLHYFKTYYKFNIIKNKDYQIHIKKIFMNLFDFNEKSVEEYNLKLFCHF